MRDGPGPIARFPILLPIRCPLDGGPLELRSPNEVCCLDCGAGVRKITREVERLRAVLNPEASDIEKAAKRLKRIDPQHAPTHWYDLTPQVRKQLTDSVGAVIKTLKEGLSQ